MIKANELRIGNFIHSDLLGSNHMVKGLLQRRDGETVLYTDLQESYSDVNDWSYIQLTPEILQAAGLNMEIVGYDGYRDVFIAYLDGYNIRVTDNMEVWVNEDAVPNVKYIHQLQNLYFALTGKELEVNIPQTA